MRLTKKLLDTYMELDRQERQLQQKKELIRKAILKDGRELIVLGDVVATVTAAEREVPLPRAELEAELGEKTCRRIMRTVRYNKISVRKR